MADVNDTNSTRAKFEREQELLEDADIDEDDRRAIREFVTHRRQMEDKSLNTLISDIGNLRRAAERAETPLLEMDIGDARAFVGLLAAPKKSGGYGLDPDGSGMFGYKRVLRVFFQWLDEEPHYGEYDFGERISLPDRNTKEETISKDDLLNEDEIEQLKRACMNNRDPVLIDFLADVGARVSLATSLRVGDIDGLNTPRPTFSPNTDALSLKGVRDVSYPILYSRAELREWVNRNHPDHTGPNGRAHDEAPLFPVVEHYDPDDREMMAAHTSTVRKSMKRAADRAGLDVERVHPHHFRHVFMTRISDSELNDRDIEHMSMLVDDRMRMRDRYDHTTRSSTPPRRSPNASSRSRTASRSSRRASSASSRSRRSSTRSEEGASATAASSRSSRAAISSSSSARSSTRAAGPSASPASPSSSAPPSAASSDSTSR
ncbi:hypothetical protein DJ84_09675 [Halorubrum ezzemoulense]|nr:hypothetical protein DJ84_09675 [Halorubrum ezzemoulense]